MNVLLLDTNFDYCKTLMNSMSALNDEIRISFIANSLKDLSYAYIADVILADYEFYDTGLEVRFSNCKIIYLSDDPSNELAIPKNNIDYIIKSLERKSSNLSEPHIESLLYSEMASLGYNLSLLGSKCILEALKIMYYSNNALLHKSLVNDIYPKIAENLGLSISVIKGNMNYATSKMLGNIDKEYLMQYFDYNLTGKVGVKSILHQIIKKLKSY